MSARAPLDDRPGTGAPRPPWPRVPPPQNRRRRPPPPPPVRLTARGRLVIAAGVVGAVALGIGLNGSGPPEQLRESVSADAVAPTGDVPDPVAVTPSATAPADPPRSVPATTAPAAPAPVVVGGREQPPRVEPPTSGTGTLAVVAGAAPAVGGGDVLTYRIEVEGGLPFDGAEFGAAVQATLGDPRSWSTRGFGFQRVDGEASMRVILASPAMVDRMCAPLQTRGQVSCRTGDAVVLNALRWGTGAEAYGDDIASYREYLVNHEVGHRLGFGHVQCPAAGAPAPVMMQQTYGLDGCAGNVWPLADE